MLSEFKKFILRGNALDLAVGIVIGAAFTAVVTAVVDNLLTPLISVPGSANFSSFSFTLGGGTFAYGQVLNAIITFVLTGAAVFFFFVKPINLLMERRKTEPDVSSTTKQCPECLSNVPTEARRCAFCAQPLTTPERAS